MDDSQEKDGCSFGGEEHISVHGVEEHRVHDEAEVCRLDVYSAGVFARLNSRRAAYKAIKRGELLLDGEPSQPHWPVEPGQRLTLRPSTRDCQRPVYQLDLPVLLEDSWLAVVHKPAGIAVSGNAFQTVENALPGNLMPSSLPDALNRPRPVHRLDAPTSGLLLIGKTATALAHLGRQFQQRTVWKRYRAIVTGCLEGETMINDPIDGRPAATAVRTVAQSRSLRTEWITTVDLWPHTGRTHQLRIHMAGIGHPIVGDRQYGTPEETFRGKGLFLAAVEVGFRHPGTDEEVHLTLDEPRKFVSYRDREARRWLRARGTSDGLPR